MKCPKWNNLLFYVENEYVHKCPFNENKIYEINEYFFRNKSNEFICDITNIDNKCIKN